MIQIDHFAPKSQALLLFQKSERVRWEVEPSAIWPPSFVEPATTLGLEADTISIFKVKLKTFPFDKAYR